MGIAYPYYKGVKNYKELIAFMDNSPHGEMPECEMFAELSEGDFELIKGKGYIAEEPTDDELIKSVPRTLKEALGIERKEAQMVCSKCKKKIGTPDLPPQYQQAFQVRVGYKEDDGVTFIPDEDVGYYCSDCLSKGV